MKLNYNLSFILVLFVIQHLVSSNFVSDQVETCVCKPRKPIIKYIAIEVPKIVHVPAPPPKVHPQTKYVAIQEISLPHPPSHYPEYLQTPSHLPSPRPLTHPGLEDSNHIQGWDY